MRHRTHVRLCAALVLAVLPASACTADTDRTVLRVSAAASLTDVFEHVADAYEQREPHVAVELNVAGSTTLVEQLVQGAPVDVLVTADESTMARAVQAEAVLAPVTPLARNRLVLAVPADGPDRDLTDLADPQLLVGLCAPTVPCGAAAIDALEAAGVTPAPDTEEPDVRALLAKLAAGELDVGIVYATDVRAAAGAIRGSDLPVDSATTVVASTTATTTHADVAGDFLRFLTSDVVRGLLLEAGFEAPS